MGNQNKNVAGQDITQQGNRLKGFTDQFLGQQNADRGQALQRSNDLYGRLSGGFGNTMQGFGNMASTGGLSPDVVNRVGGLYKNFTETGGYSPEELGGIRSRSGDAATSTFRNLTDMMGRRRAMQGGYAPSYTSEVGQASRDQAEAMARNSRDTELGISNAVRQGKLLGAGGEQGLQESLRGGQLAGLGGQLQSLGGLEGLRTSAPGELNAIDRLRLGGMGLDQSGSEGLIGLREGLARMPGLYDRIIQALGAGAGALTGLGGLSSGGNTPGPASSGVFL